jgi:hypothetical protein
MATTSSTDQADAAERVLLKLGLEADDSALTARLNGPAFKAADIEFNLQPTAVLDALAPQITPKHYPVVDPALLQKLASNVDLFPVHNTSEAEDAARIKTMKERINTLTKLANELPTTDIFPHHAHLSSALGDYDAVSDTFKDLQAAVMDYNAAVQAKTLKLTFVKDLVTELAVSRDELEANIDEYLAELRLSCDKDAASLSVRGVLNSTVLSYESTFDVGQASTPTDIQKTRQTNAINRKALVAADIKLAEAALVAAKLELTEAESHLVGNWVKTNPSPLPTRLTERLNDTIAEFEQSVVYAQAMVATAQAGGILNAYAKAVTKVNNAVSAREHLESMHTAYEEISVYTNTLNNDISVYWTSFKETIIFADYQGEPSVVMENAIVALKEAREASAQYRESTKTSDGRKFVISLLRERLSTISKFDAIDTEPINAWVAQLESM